MDTYACLYLTSLQVHSSGEVIVLEISCPWTEHLFALEEKLGFVEQVKFVLYGEKGSDKWRIQVKLFDAVYVVMCANIPLKYSHIFVTNCLWEPSCVD